MAAGRLLLPSWMPALDGNGAPIPNATVYFYNNMTDTLAAVFSDQALSIPLTNPVVANASGRFPAVWANDAVLYSASVEAPYGPAGVPFTYDDLSASMAADILVAGAAEAAANEASASAATAAQALADIIDIAANAPEAPSIANKANVDGGNIPNAETFRISIGANWVLASEDPVRNYARVTAPYLGDANFIDNVLAIQNKSVGLPGGVLGRGNAAINFLDSAGVERGAMGYSRNSLLAPNSGYYADTMYIEIGNPFTTDTACSNFKLINTHKAGGPYWGGAAISYFPIRVDANTGDTRFSTNGGLGGGSTTFEDGFNVGTPGNPRVVRNTMSTTSARFRERNTADYFTITTNISDPQNGIPTSPTPDSTGLSCWEVGLGAGRDYFSVERWPAGTGQAAANVFRATLSNFMIGQTTTGAGSDGRLAVTTGGGTAITAKTTTGDAFPAMIAWNNATANNNLLIAFGTETAYTARGNIAYNRGAGQIAYNTTSDHRAKDIEGDLEGALSAVNRMTPRVGRMHGAENSMPLFVAHELALTAPYAVTGVKDAVDEDGVPVMQSVDLAKLVPLLVRAIQELSAEVKVLKDAAR